MRGSISLSSCCVPAGCEGGEGQRAGALLRRLGPHGPGLLPGQPPPGPLLQDLQRLHGKDTAIPVPTGPGEGPRTFPGTSVGDLHKAALVLSWAGIAVGTTAAAR